MVRVTKGHIEQAAFAGPEEVEELTLQRMGITDVGEVASCRAVQTLSLAFNSLSSLKGLHQCTSLRTLNVMRNSITSLEPIAGLPALTILKASHNKISSLEPLRGAGSLRELWVQSNNLTKAEASWALLELLESLPAVTHLMVTPNPACESLGPHYRAAIIGVSPNLQVLDGEAVTDLERAASGSILTQVREQLAAVGIPRTMSGREASTTAAAAEEEAAEESVADPPKTPKRPVHLPNQSTAPRAAKPKTAAAVTAVKPSSSESAAAPAVPARPPVDLTSPLSAVLSTLPILNAPPQIKGPPKMKRSTKKSVVSVDDDPQAHAVLYELKYSGRVGYGLALQIRGDGGVSAKYPDGSTAVAVESAIDGGKIVYTMMAMYPGTGTFAVNLDAKSGGFVQGPDGSIALLINADDGVCSVFDKGGNITKRIKRNDRDSVNIELSRNLSFRMDCPGFKCSLEFRSESITERIVHGRNEVSEEKMAANAATSTMKKPAMLSAAAGASSPKKPPAAAAAGKKPAAKGAAATKGAGAAGGTGSGVSEIAATSDEIASAIASLHSNLLAQMQSLAKMDPLNDPEPEPEAEVGSEGLAAGLGADDTGGPAPSAGNSE